MKTEKMGLPSDNVIKFSDTGNEGSLIMNECIRQRMHLFCHLGMTSKRIEKSAKKTIQREEIMRLYRGS